MRSSDPCRFVLRGAAVLSAAALLVVARPTPALSTTVGVLDFKGGKKTKRLRKYLTERVRAQAAERGRDRGWSVLTRPQMKQALGKKRRKCIVSGRCGPRKLSALKADLIVSGELVQFGKLRLAMQMYRTTDNSLVSAAEVVGSDLDSLVDGLDPGSGRLFAAGRPKVKPRKKAAAGRPTPKLRRAAPTQVPRPRPKVAPRPARKRAPNVTPRHAVRERRAKVPRAATAARTRVAAGAALAVRTSPLPVPAPPVAEVKQVGRVASYGPATITGRGKIDRGQLRTAVERLSGHVRRCYQSRLDERLDLSGVVEISFGLDGRGSVRKVAVGRNTTGDPQVAGCIATSAKGWVLPKPWGGNVRVGYPFLLQLRPDDGTAAPKLGKLEPSLIKTVVAKQVGRARACYDRALKRNPDLSGRLMARFTIVETGQVDGLGVVEDTLRDTRLRRCVLTQMQLWRFPLPLGGPIVVQYPFAFESARGDDSSGRKSRKYRAGVGARLKIAARKVRKCIVDATRGAWAPRGAVRVKVTIGARGGRPGVQVMDHTTGARQAPACARKVVGALKLGLPVKGPVAFVYPLELGPGR